jgi:NAD+ synthase
MKIPFDAARARQTITDWIREYCQKAGRTKGVVGLSGGIDSSVTVCLAAHALGPHNVWGLILPYEFTPRPDIAHAVRLAKKLGINWGRIDIDPIVDSFGKVLGRLGMMDKLSMGNIQARVRMTILYQRARVHGAIVIGTSNKSELLLGYFTKYGDGAADILPLGDVYKTQVRQLASHLELPHHIIKKIPSAWLWLGQTDEGELSEKIGFDVTYRMLDAILYLWYDLGLRPAKVAQQLKVDKRLVSSVTRLVKVNLHKRRTPPVCRL